jgi:DNA mismatch repair ATPase MutS
MLPPLLERACMLAGKSTVLRAVAAAALCGSVGLAVPAAPGSLLPELDAVVLRTFSGDAPQQGLSAFGVEMREMR